MEGINEPQINLKKVCGAVLALYLLLTVSFYFLAGDQLLYRSSRGNLSAPAAEAGTVELCQGAVVEQSFTMKIQRLESLSVQWGTYYRPNAGTITMELWDQATGRLLLQWNFDVSAIPEGGFTTLTAEEPLEGLYQVPLLLRLWSDAQPGAAASPLMNVSGGGEGDFSLALNGEAAEGRLCLSVSGTDYIWTGLHYKSFVAIGFALLLGFFGLVAWRRKKGRSYVFNALLAIRKYRFLIRQLVSRDFKTKYKRSVLGMFWSFLNPLLTMLVQYVVFSTIFRSDIPNFAAYLIIGTVMFNFFSEASGMALSSVLGNAGLIKKVYMPKYIYPLTRVMSSVVNLVISLIPLLMVCLLTGVEFHKSAVLSLYFFCCLIVFSLGLGLLLSTSMVFFRDTQFLWGVLSMMWMYATPIFYPETIIPADLRVVLTMNPLYYFLKSARMCIMEGLSPEPIVYVQCMLMALAMLAVGALVFYRNQDKFVLYL